MTRLNRSIAARSLFYQFLGLTLALGAVGTLQYFTLRQQIIEAVLTTGQGALKTIEVVLNDDPHLLADESLQTIVLNIASKVQVITRLSVTNRALRVVADTEPDRLAQITDQTAIIELVSQPEQARPPLYYTRGGLHYARLSAPVLEAGTTVVGAITIDISLSDAEAELRATFLQSLAMLGGLMAMYLFGQYWLLRQTLYQPLSGLTQAARELGRGNLAARAPAHQTDELGELGRAFNDMADEIGRTSAALRENSQSLQTIIRSSPLAMIEMDLARNVKRWNPAAERIFGWTEAEALGHPLQTVPPDKMAESLAIFESLMQGKPLTVVNTQRLRNDGTRVEVSISAVALRDSTGQITGFSSIIADISRLKQAEDAMQTSNASLSLSVAKLEQRAHDLTVLGEFGDLLQSCVKSEEAHHVVARSVRKLFPNQPGTLYEIPPSRDHMEPLVSWGESETKPRPFAMEACWALRRGRTHRVEEGEDRLVCQHIADEQGEPFSYLCVPMMAQGEALGLLHLSCAPGSPAFTEENQQLAETVAEQIALALSNLKLREALRQQSIRDTLTGLYNRRYLDETLTREIARAKRSNIPLSIIMLDLDHFKSFNDTYGHEAGDLVLRALGQFLRTQVRADDIACRYGGEEFTLILPSASLERAQQRAEQLRVGIHALKLNFEGQALRTLTLSLGVAVFPAHGENGPAVLQAADAALYRAKQKGRDRLELAA